MFQRPRPRLKKFFAPLFFKKEALSLISPKEIMR